MRELRGKVVLVDFWTYTCVNCIRTFPYLKEWHAKYASLGLTIVGVHSPEFDFEKVRENVVRNAGEHGLNYPIAQDNDFETWRAYSNQYWPAKYLIDKGGAVRYSHFGEGGYDVMEQMIRGLLEDAGADVSSIVAGADPGQAPDPRASAPDTEDRLTRELYGGYQRNAGGGLYVLHQEYYLGPERIVEYQDPGGHLNHFIYLQGSWFNGLEDLVHARQTDRFQDYVAVKFSATSVNAVVGPKDGKPFEVFVTLDGLPLTSEEAGGDGVVEGGRSFFVVRDARRYRVVHVPAYGAHELKLSSNSPGFALFAFTFGGYSEGP
jgi:thiol-disulfide isomerase/thioredoxin